MVTELLRLSSRHALTYGLPDDFHAHFYKMSGSIYGPAALVAVIIHPTLERVSVLILCTKTGPRELI